MDGIRLAIYCYPDKKVNYYWVLSVESLSDIREKEEETDFDDFRYIPNISGFDEKGSHVLYHDTCDNITKDVWTSKFKENISKIEDEANLKIQTKDEYFFWEDGEMNSNQNPHAIWLKAAEIAKTINL